MSNIVQTPSTVWKAGDDVRATVTDLIKKYHPDLILVDEQIAILFKEKSSAVGDSVVTGKTSKASPLLGVLGEIDYKFIITLGADTWGEMTPGQQIALLDHHLCACGVEENPKTGNTKYFVRLPDVAFFQSEVERHGWWRTSGKMPTQDYITELFGED